MAWKISFFLSISLVLAFLTEIFSDGGDSSRRRLSSDVIPSTPSSDRDPFIDFGVAGRNSTVSVPSNPGSSSPGLSPVSRLSPPEVESGYNLGASHPMSDDLFRPAAGPQADSRRSRLARRRGGIDPTDAKHVEAEVFFRSPDPDYEPELPAPNKLQVSFNEQDPLLVTVTFGEIYTDIDLFEVEKAVIERDMQMRVLEVTEQLKGKNSPVVKRTKQSLDGVRRVGAAFESSPHLSEQEKEKFRRLQGDYVGPEQELAAKEGLLSQLSKEDRQRVATIRAFLRNNTGLKLLARQVAEAKKLDPKDSPAEPEHTPGQNIDAAMADKLIHHSRISAGNDFAQTLDAYAQNRQTLEANFKNEREDAKKAFVDRGEKQDGLEVKLGLIDAGVAEVVRGQLKEETWWQSGFRKVGEFFTSIFGKPAEGRATGEEVNKAIGNFN